MKQRPCKVQFSSLRAAAARQSAVFNQRLVFALQADGAVHSLGDRRRDARALQQSSARLSVLCVKKAAVVIAPLPGSRAALHFSTATARSPCLPSETCTSFQANDTI